MVLLLINIFIAILLHLFFTFCRNIFKEFIQIFYVLLQKFIYLQQSYYGKRKTY